MINFRQKNFSEYDAMRTLYVELMKRTNGDRNKFPTINSSALIPILRGNNIVIERFVISTSFFNKDKYRMYLKIGAKAKLPDDVRLSPKVYDRRLGNISLSLSKKIFSDNNDRVKLFSKNKNRNGGNSNREVVSIITGNQITITDSRIITIITEETRAVSLSIAHLVQTST